MPARQRVATPRCPGKLARVPTDGDSWRRAGLVAGEAMAQLGPYQRAQHRSPRCQLLPLPRPRIHPGPARICQCDPVPRPGGLGWGFPPLIPPAGGAIGAERGAKMGLRTAHGGAIGAAGGPRLVMAGGSAVLGLAGNQVEAGGTAGRGSAGVLEAHTPFPRPGGRHERRHSDQWWCPGLLIPTTAAATDPPRTGQASSRGPLAAPRRVRPGFPAPDPPGARLF